MSNKVFYGIIGVLVVGAIGFAVLKKEPAQPRIGTEQADEGREHIPDGQEQTYAAHIPTSGPHSSPVAWRAYDQQVPDENLIHNMEHGGVVISYRPDLDPATIDQLVRLFTPPYVVSGFSPTKAVVMPRAGQEKQIVLASWNRVLELDSYDEQTLIDYYLSNINKSPEPTAS